MVYLCPGMIPMDTWRIPMRKEPQMISVTPRKPNPGVLSNPQTHGLQLYTLSIWLRTLDSWTNETPFVDHSFANVPMLSWCINGSFWLYDNPFCIAVLWLTCKSGWYVSKLGISSWSWNKSLKQPSRDERERELHHHFTISSLSLITQIPHFEPTSGYDGSTPCSSSNPHQLLLKSHCWKSLESISFLKNGST